MTEDLPTLLELLKQSAQDTPPDEGEIDPEILDGIRAHGAAAVDPLINLIQEVMAANWAVIDNEEAPWNYAHVHAVGLLSQLPLTPPVVSLLFDLDEQYDDDEWYSEEIIGEIWHAGEVTVEPCLAALRDRSRSEYGRNGVADLLEKVAEEYPDLRDRIADGLVEIMSSVTREDEDWDDWATNAFMLGALGATRAERYIPFVHQMFEQDRVDVMILGLDWVLDSIQGIDPMERHKEEFDEDTKFDLREMLQRAATMSEAMKARKSPGEYPHPEIKPWPELPPPPPAAPLSRQWETVVNPKRPGRNDPCWCGSGKKYKKCHMHEDQEKDRQGRSQ